MTFPKQTTKQGFTLIEIMVVISIIGILATSGYINYNESRLMARDKARAASIKQLQVAINGYKDTYGKYPTGCGAEVDKWTGPGPKGSVLDVSCDVYIDGLVPEFISVLPIDPKSENEPGKGFMYKTDSTQQTYKLLINQSVEKNFVTGYDKDLARCQNSCLGAYPGNTYCNNTPEQNPQKDTYAVYSGGAAICW